MSEKPTILTPPRWRVILAFALAPGLAALVAASFEPLYQGLPYVERVLRTGLVFAIFGYAVSLIIGVPTYLALSRRVRASWLNCSLAGAVIAALPWLLLFMVVPSADHANFDGKATVVNGSRTLYGFLKELEIVGLIGLFGFVGGFIFWLVATAGFSNRHSSDTSRVFNADT